MASGVRFYYRKEVVGELQAGSLRRWLELATLKVETEAKRRCPAPGSSVYPTHSTGNLRRSISSRVLGAPSVSGGIFGEVRATAHYAAYVEYGTRHMHPRPFMRPALEALK